MLNDLFADSTFESILVIFLVCYFVAGIFLIQNYSNKKCIILSVLMGLVSIVSVGKIQKLPDKIVEDRIYNEAKSLSEYYLSDDYDDIMDTLDNRTERSIGSSDFYKNLDEWDDSINNRRLANKTIGGGRDEYIEFSKETGLYDNKAIYLSELKSMGYYSVLTFFITYGLMFCLIMLPFKIAAENNLEQKTIIGVISLLFGGTVIIWLVMLIWATSLKQSSTVQYSQTSTKEEITISDKLQDLKKLLDQGLITQAEFDQKRGELLRKM